MASSSREKILCQLRRKLEASPHEERDERQVVSTGFPALDRLLPKGGLMRGTLVEWLSPGPGSGAGTLALFTLLAAAQKRGALVICDYARQWNAAVTSASLFSTPLILLRPPTLADQWWGAEQALRCPAVAAVWLPCEQIDSREFRRLQLAAEAGQGLGLLLRPARMRSQPSWAEVRLLVEPCAGASTGRTVRATVLRSRGGGAGRSVDLVLDGRADVPETMRDNHEALPVSAISPVAAAAPRRRSAGA